MVESEVLCAASQTGACVNIPGSIVLRSGTKVASFFNPSSPAVLFGALMRVRWAVLLCLWIVATGCPRNTGVTGTPVGPANKPRTFVSWNFFSIDYPLDWVARDLEDGANLFYADEMLFVGVKIYEAPDANDLNAYVESRINTDAAIEGSKPPVLLKTGTKGPHAYFYYELPKPNGQRFQEVILANMDLKLIYVISGRSRQEDFEEFQKIFDNMFESFQFRVTARIPSGSEQGFQPDLSSMSGAWVSYLEGLRGEDYDLMAKACARVNSSKIINDAQVRRVRAQYFPYNNPIYTFVSQVEVRDRLASVTVSVRALPPDGFLKHEVREFIKEEDHWRLLRFEKAE